MSGVNKLLGALSFSTFVLAKAPFRSENLEIIMKSFKKTCPSKVNAYHRIRSISRVFLGKRKFIYLFISLFTVRD